MGLKIFSWIGLIALIVLIGVVIAQGIEYVDEQGKLVVEYDILLPPNMITIANNINGVSSVSVDNIARKTIITYSRVTNGIIFNNVTLAKQNVEALVTIVRDQQARRIMPIGIPFCYNNGGVIESYSPQNTAVGFVLKKDVVTSPLC